MKKNLVRVTIMDEEYAIRSDASPEHTKAVAAYLEDAIRRVLDTGSVVETSRATILAALQITGELFEARDSQDGADSGSDGRVAATSDIARRLRDLSAEVRHMLPPAKRGEPAA
ncbi:MAG TPA: cell division protein ZapA [Gemmatimonadaceae bacterium]|nr:cell division protein ZapA [Gemmatimonadaceae bacterium]